MDQYANIIRNKGKKAEAIKYSSLREELINSQNIALNVIEKYSRQGEVHPSAIPLDTSSKIDLPFAQYTGTRFPI